MRPSDISRALLLRWLEARGDDRNNNPRRNLNVGEKRRRSDSTKPSDANGRRC